MWAAWLHSGRRHLISSGLSHFWKSHPRCLHPWCSLLCRQWFCNYQPWTIPFSKNALKQFWGELIQWWLLVKWTEPCNMLSQLPDPFLGIRAGLSLRQVLHGARARTMKCFLKAHPQGFLFPYREETWRCCALRSFLECRASTVIYKGHISPAVI